MMENVPLQGRVWDPANMALYLARAALRRPRAMAVVVIALAAVQVCLLVVSGWLLAAGEAPLREATVALGSGLDDVEGRLATLEARGQAVLARRADPWARIPDPPAESEELETYEAVLGAIMRRDTGLDPYAERRVALAVLAAARRQGLDPWLVTAVINVESHFRAGAVSSKGARGLMQLRPSTAEWMALRAGIDPTLLDMSDPATNVQLGTEYLGYLLDRFRSVGRALAAYNLGPTRVRELTREHGAIPPPYDAYSRRVLSEWERFKREGPVVAMSDPGDHGEG